MNSYILSPRSVTAQPIGMPLRILKFAMDFFARVMIGFWPLIWPSSTAAVSSSLAFWLASPRPMLSVTFCSLGTAMTLSQPKRFMSAGTVSLLYFSCNRLFIASLPLPRVVASCLLIERCVAFSANARLGAVGGDFVADAGVLTAAGADDHHVGNVDGRFFFDDAALDVFLRIRPRVALDDRDVLDHQAIRFGVDREHASGLARVAPGHHFDVVALANLNPVAYCALMPQCPCHCLPNLRSERNDLGEFLFAQLSGHRAEHAGSHRLARIVDQHRGVVVEPDVGAILAAALFAHPNDYCFNHRAF